jgi:hypothetical protein
MVQSEVPGSSPCVLFGTPFCFAFLPFFQALPEFVYPKGGSVSGVEVSATSVGQLSPAPEQFLLVIGKSGKNTLPEDIEERITHNSISIKNAIASSYPQFSGIVPVNLPALDASNNNVMKRSRPI